MQNAWQFQCLDGHDVQDHLIEAKPEASPYKLTFLEGQGQTSIPAGTSTVIDLLGATLLGHACLSKH